jgi:hypothetical protein
MKVNMRIDKKIGNVSLFFVKLDNKPDITFKLRLENKTNFRIGELVIYFMGYFLNINYFKDKNKILGLE